MADKSPEEQITDAVSAFAGEMGKAAAAYQSAMSDWMKAWQAPLRAATPEIKVNGSGNGAAAQPTFDPQKVMQGQLELMRDYQALWLGTMQRLMNQQPAEPVVTPEPGDNRFKDPAWSENPVFDFIKQSYLLNARWLRKTLGEVEGIDADAAHKLDFYGRALVDAMSPTNFPLTNPAVLRETAETKGENLRKGFANFLEDVKGGGGALRPRHTDMSAFEVGRNIAVSPGAVVFQNELFQLLQYAPTTETVYKRPLLIIPPWINKFYILDLRPDNSFIRWATAQGYTVFVMSWVNPDERFKELSFADYLKQGIFAALDAVKDATGERQMSAIGYCIGGTLLAMALAYMAAKGDDRITSATFFAAQVDFTEAGDLRVFTDAQQVAAIEQQVKAKGYLDGGAMAAIFNMLRANDLIWSFFVNNYLMGKDPQAFDLLYWNADPTRFPARLLVDYLRGMYGENNLVKKGGFVIDGVPIDLTQIKIPLYIQATREDHIAPAKSVFKGMKVLGGDKRFVLAGSGHIAGVINPPDKKKYQHWINESGKAYADVESWLAAAKEHPGSWWPDWDTWLGAKSGERVPARKIGRSIEPAPGSYVKVKG
jgi:polyhydroxyalkanoate synthase subunit PhaC